MSPREEAPLIAGAVPEAKGSPGFVGIWPMSQLSKSPEAPPPLARRSFFRVLHPLLHLLGHLSARASLKALLVYSLICVASLLVHVSDYLPPCRSVCCSFVVCLSACWSFCCLCLSVCLCICLFACSCEKLVLRPPVSGDGSRNAPLTNPIPKKHTCTNACAC